MADQKKPTLFALVETRRQVIDKIISQFGEILPEDDVALAGSETAIAVKAEAYLAVIDNAVNEAARAKAYAAQVLEHAKSCEKLAGNLRSRLADGLKSADLKNIKAGYRTLSLVKGRGSVEILDKDVIPSRFTTYEMVEKITIDKKAIGAAIKAGETVPGATVLIGPDTVRIPKLKENNDE